MVVGIPLAKLVPLLLKTVTKPFVDSLKRNVKKSPFWKDDVFIPMAEYYNKQSVRARLWTQGIHRNKDQLAKYSKLSEEAALELGAEIVANTVTLFIGLAAIVMQQSISAATEKKKSASEASQMERIERGILELQNKQFDQGLLLAEQDAKIRELNRLILSLPNYGKSNESDSLKNKNENKS